MSRFDPFLTAARLVDCVCPRLKDPARGEDAWVGECCVWPGSHASLVDCCDDGGQLSVVAINGFPTTSFPSPATVVQSCGPVTNTWATVYELKVTRCVPTGLDCDCDCKEAAAARIMGDLKAVLEGVACCFVEDPDDDCAQFTINGWRLLAPEGGCSGVAVTITVESDAICCPQGG